MAKLYKGARVESLGDFKANYSDKLLVFKGQRGTIKTIARDEGWSASKVFVDWDGATGWWMWAKDVKLVSPLIALAEITE